MVLACKATSREGRHATFAVPRLWTEFRLRVTSHVAKVGRQLVARKAHAAESFRCRAYPARAQAARTPKPTRGLELAPGKQLAAHDGAEGGRLPGRHLGIGGYDDAPGQRLYQPRAELVLRASRGWVLGATAWLDLRQTGPRAPLPVGGARLDREGRGQEVHCRCLWGRRQACRPCRLALTRAVTQAHLLVCFR